MELYSSMATLKVYQGFRQRGKWKIPSPKIAVILFTSKCFKMTPYAIKMHLESIKLQ
jgi:hypothetical protein